MTALVFSINSCFWQVRWAAIAFECAWHIDSFPRRLVGQSSWTPTALFFKPPCVFGSVPQPFDFCGRIQGETAAQLASSRSILEREVKEKTSCFIQLERVSQQGWPSFPRESLLNRVTDDRALAVEPDLNTWELDKLCVRVYTHRCLYDTHYSLPLPAIAISASANLLRKV